MKSYIIKRLSILYSACQCGRGYFVNFFFFYSLSSLERSLSERLDFFLRRLGLRDLDLCLRDRDLDRCRCLKRYRKYCYTILLLLIYITILLFYYFR